MADIVPKIVYNIIGKILTKEIFLTFNMDINIIKVVVIIVDIYVTLTDNPNE
ncbi:MAG: hypothetical protein K5666_00300 [Bacilli bacterium]|nr:hypothetical protein [Bacilli bacterium]